MQNKPKDPLHERIVIGVAASGSVAIERARATGTPLVIWRDNHIETIKPDAISKPSTKPNGKQKY
jgi:hypothetical protein